MTSLEIAGRSVGEGQPVYIVAELSANHAQHYERAARIVELAAQAGADAIKVQTYTADSMTLRSDAACFRVAGGTAWDGRTLHDLYQEAAMPWAWQPPLKALAESLGMHFFSSAFDAESVDFLERLGVVAHKVASFELVDLPLIERMSRGGLPLIMSTGMANLAEIEEAVRTARAAGAGGVALLKCTSAYPAPFEEMHLRTIPHLAAAFAVPVGISDHSLGIAVPCAATALGACIVEKHLTLARSDGGPDSQFSLEPDEFAQMVATVRATERALGRVNYEPSAHEAATRVYRRSLFVARDVAAGEPLTESNVRCIRPGHGLHPRHYREVLGRRAARDIAAGTPLAWDLLG